MDALTALPNRRQLIRRIERAIEISRRGEHQVALLLVDLDRFKIINDTLGHSAGDELLLEVSRRLKKCVPHCDDVLEPGSVPQTAVGLEAVARLTGDEFMALLPEVADEGEAQRLAAQVLEALREPLLVGGQECFMTASIGIALYPRDGANAADLMKNADVAMHAVKAAGRNDASLYSPALAGRGRALLELESALHKAIERDELVVHYQPKVDVRNARMVGAEALMRWNRGGKLISPSAFIPLAEESGLIVPLSEWVLQEAARQARIWQDRFGLGVSIAVNLPPRIFERTDLVELIQSAVTACGVEQARSNSRSRDRLDEGTAQRDPDAAPLEADRRADRDRRLRHRLFVARLPDDLADQRVEDRPKLHPRARRRAQEFCGGHVGRISPDAMPGRYFSCWARVPPMSRSSAAISERVPSEPTPI